MSLTYNLGWLAEESRKHSACYYNIGPVSTDLVDIASLGGKPLSGSQFDFLAALFSGTTINANEFCGTAVETRERVPEDCPQAFLCNVNIAQGKKAFTELHLIKIRGEMLKFMRIRPVLQYTKRQMGRIISG